MFGNTPTGVGKTLCCANSILIVWKHPHGRGEDPPSASNTGLYQETPPRAWGRRCKYDRVNAGGRNTPTGVGKTQRRTFQGLAYGKHPHGRGEDKTC